MGFVISDLAIARTINFKKGKYSINMMRITDQTVYDVTKQVVGEDAVQIVQFLKDKKNISEFTIAEKIKAEINQIRNVLYRLHNYNLVTYIKKKDRQKGWYISYWTFNRKRVKDLIEQIKKSSLAKYRERLEKELANKDTFFMCGSACIRLGFQDATEFRFKCPECGKLLNQIDNSKTIEMLQKKIKEIEKKK